MSGFWLLSYVASWLLVIGGGLLILALAREVESLHRRLDALEKHLQRLTVGDEARERRAPDQQTRS